MQLLAAPQRRAAPCRTVHAQNRRPRMHCRAHVPTNSSHARELVQFVASLLKSDKQWKVLSGCLEKFSHGWSLGYSDIPSSKYEASLEIFLRETLGQTFGIRSGLGCGLGFAFGKSVVRLQIYPRVNLSVLETTLGEIFQTTTADFPLFVPHLSYLDMDMCGEYCSCSLKTLPDFEFCSNFTWEM